LVQPRPHLGGRGSLGGSHEPRLPFRRLDELDDVAPPDVLLPTDVLFRFIRVEAQAP